MPGVRQTSYTSSNLMSIHPNLQSLLSLKPGFLPHFMKKEILSSSYDIYLKDCPSRGGVLLAVASHTITHNLSWSDYIQTTVSKAYRMLCFIRRSFMSGPTHIRRELHITLLRSQPTYCSQIWRPHVLKKIK